MYIEFTQPGRSRTNAVSVSIINPFVELQSSSAVEASRPAEQADKEAEPASVEVRPTTDIQAVLTVLGRRDKTARKQDQAAYRRLDLTKTHLEGADLFGAHLEGANLGDAHLQGADLWEAHLEHASLSLAHLQGAKLVGAVGLTQEQLEGASGDDRTLLPDGLTRPAWPAWPAVTPEEPDNAE